MVAGRPRENERRDALGASPSVGGTEMDCCLDFDARADSRRYEVTTVRKLR